MNTRYTKKEFEKLLTEKLFNEFAIDIASATDEQIYRALALIARGMLSEKRKRFIARTYGANGKQVYYLCMEFLMGRSLKTSLLNLGLCGVADEVLRDYSMKLDNIYEQEPDAGLGNGGLGRLAACYLDGMATDDIPGTGYSILYEYGIFKQKIVDGWQQERADNWLPGGGVWLKSHPDQAVEVRFDGEIEESWDGVYHHVEHKNYSSVIAVPSDMYVAGYDSNGVSQLRLWQAKAPGFDMDSFNAGEYGSAITKSANAELISKVLYPNDNHIEGKILRLRQQYFLSAAKRRCRAFTKSAWSWTTAAAPTWSAPSPATRARSTTWPFWATARCAWPTSAAMYAIPSTACLSCTARSSSRACSTTISCTAPKNSPT